MGVQLGKPQRLSEFPRTLLAISHRNTISWPEYKPLIDLQYFRKLFTPLKSEFLKLIYFHSHVITRIDVNLIGHNYNNFSLWLRRGFVMAGPYMGFVVSY